jgi:hypothetical protein
MGMRIFQVHVERGRIGGADPFKSSLAAPEFHAAFEVRVENPHAILSTPEGPEMEPAFSRGYLIAWREDKSEAWEGGECEKSGIDSTLL